MTDDTSVDRLSTAIPLVEPWASRWLGDRRSHGPGYVVGGGRPTGPSGLRRVAGKLRAYRSLAASRKRVLVEAGVLLASTRLGALALSFDRLRRLASLVAGGLPRTTPDGRVSADDLAWAVAAASRYVPRATCLVQAIALEVLLGRHGHPAELCIGMAMGAAGRLEGHAWVTSGGRVLIGGPDVGRFARIAVAGAGCADPARTAARP